VTLDTPVRELLPPEVWSRILAYAHLSSSCRATKTLAPDIRLRVPSPLDCGCLCKEQPLNPEKNKTHSTEPWARNTTSISYFAIATCDFVSNFRACEIRSTTSNGLTSDGIPFASR
jgi:hypothetical protein